MSNPDPGDAGRTAGRQAGGTGRLGPTADGRRRTAERLLAATGRGAAVERLVDLAARLLGAPSAQVSILTDVQTVAAATGGAAGAVGSVGPLADSLCTVTASGRRPLVVDDARGDGRVSSLPPVTSGAVGAYLGVPLTSSSGEIVGALCVHDARAREWAEGSVGILEQLASSVVTELEMSALTADYEADRGRWELAIGAAGIGSFDLDLRTGRLAWDDRLLDLFGHDAATFDGSLASFNSSIHPDDLARITEARERAVAELGTYEAEYRILHPSGRTRWVQARGRVIGDRDGTPVRLIGAALDTTALREGEARSVRAERRASLLGQVTSDLGSTLDAVEGAERLARLMVPTLARWCIVSLVDDDKEGPLERRIRDVAWSHVDPARLPILDEYARLRVASLVEDSFLHRALLQGRRVVVGSGATPAVTAVLRPGPARRALAELGPEAVAIFPLRAHGRNVGLLTLFRDRADGAFSDGDLLTAGEAAARAGMAFDNARLYADQRDLALGLQQSLLTPPPDSDLGEIAVRYVPAAETARVGGDWYDTFEQRPGTTMLVIGDVVGHDTAAAAAMGQLRGLLRGIAVTTGEGPGAVLARLDRAMDRLEIDTTATAAVASLERAGDGSAGDGPRRGVHVRWSNAGHPPPMAVGPDGSVTVLGGGGPELLLGVDPATSRTSSDSVLGPGWTVLLYTDGLVEARDQPLGDGLARLAATLGSLAGRSPGALCDEVLARMLPASRSDDVALVAVRLDPR